MPELINSRQCKSLAHICCYLVSNLYRYPVAHRARDSLDIARPQLGISGDDQTMELISPDPIHPPHPVLRHQATNRPNDHGDPEQNPGRYGFPPEQSSVSEIVALYKRPGDPVANSSQKLNYHRDDHVVTGFHPLREQPGPSGHNQHGHRPNKPTVFSHRNNRLGHEADSSLPDLPPLRGPVDRYQTPDAPRLQAANRYPDRAVDHAPTARLRQDVGVTGQALRYLRDDGSDDDDGGHGGDGAHIPTVHKQHNDQVYLPTGYRKMQKNHEVVDAALEKRGRPRAHLEDRFDDDLQQSSKDKTDTTQTKGHCDEHLSHTTTVSYMIKQANDVSQQQPSQLLPALPVHPDKHRPSPLDVEVAQAVHKKSQEKKDPYEIVHNIVKPKNHRLRIRRRAEVPEQQKVLPQHLEVKLDPPRPTSSVYSQNTMDIQNSARVSPLRINKASDLPGKDNIIEEYQQWGEQKKEAHGLSKSLTMPEIDEIRQISPYTPLTGWLERDQDLRKGKKTMVGANGWLENAAIESQARLEPKKSFFTSVKKRVQDMVSILARFP